VLDLAGKRLFALVAQPHMRVSLMQLTTLHPTDKRSLAESKLIESEKRHIDNTLERVAQKEQQISHTSVTTLQSDKAVLTKELHAERKRLGEAKSKLQEKEQELQALANKVQLPFLFGALILTRGVWQRVLAALPSESHMSDACL
jgi:hypothetical protein